MNKPSVAPVKVRRFKQENFSNEDDLVAVEEPMEIRLEYGAQNERKMQSISVTMRTPGKDFALAIGFLFTEGIVKSYQDVHAVRYCSDFGTVENELNIVRVFLKETVEIDLGQLKRNFYTTSSCGICGKESIDMVRNQCAIINREKAALPTANYILSLPKVLRTQQSVFEYTGGIHAAALFDENKNPVLICEDVGRHNALDKLIGESLMKGLSFPLNNYVLLLSGRASFELLQKAAMAGISTVCAVGAPSSLAVQIAREFKINLIGFLRDQSFNIYE